MQKISDKLHNRDLYLNRLIAFQDSEPVKIITGIRRCGKSSLLRLMAQHLRQNGITDKQIIEMNFESFQFQNMTPTELYRYVEEHLPTDKRVYLFFDEIQRIPQWQDAVNSFRVDFDCDIYITGSNACLLSSEYATYLAGRSIEIKMLPLSFKEFLDFHGYKVQKTQNPAGDVHWTITDTANNIFTAEQMLTVYMRFGGMPGIADIGLDNDKANILLDGIYSTVVVRDILERDKRQNQSQISDPELLRRIILFLADNIGNSTSSNSIANILKNEKLLSSSHKGSPSVNTVQAYIASLLESFVFYEIKRFDIKGKVYLRTLGKYYIVDVGLRNYLLGYRDTDIGHIIENIVFFELKRRGFDTAIGKIQNHEIDFIASNSNRKIYIQVTESMNDPAVREREMAPLRMIQDNYEKIVIAEYCDNPMTQDGIKIEKLSDFLLK